MPIQRVEWPAREVKFSLPSRTEVKNEYSYTFTFCVCFNDVGIVNITFYRLTRK